MREDMRAYLRWHVRQHAEVIAAQAQVAGMMSAMRSAGLVDPVPDPDVEAIGTQIGFELLNRGVLRSSRCSHPRPVPVESVVTGELLARLCPDCDEQLPAQASEWWPGGMI
ncbi:hypothetical protein AB0I81_40105 [Nonomuraea sp. NPDC050404]|uniref:hypothetical protein n=1 Tax=Nonomuraea sp. NPDC050404 TaxID=3155783 RepID=UPI0033DF0F6D